jgi:hypothetical protein
MNGYELAVTAVNLRSNFRRDDSIETRKLESMNKTRNNTPPNNCCQETFAVIPPLPFLFLPYHSPTATELASKAERKALETTQKMRRSW